jgi:hypothetical protein
MKGLTLQCLSYVSRRLFGKEYAKRAAGQGELLEKISAVFALVQQHLAAGQIVLNSRDQASLALCGTGV